MNSVKTPKGTDLPLLSLKGKDYLQVAHRLVWFNEAAERFRINTDFILVTDEQTVARATVQVFNKEGIEIKSATATKRETKKDFLDHTEKAETGAIGRALALMGYGTQFAIADLDEGSRLADSPVTNTKTAAKAAATSAVTVPNDQTVSSGTLSLKTGATSVTLTPTTQAAPVKISTFRKPKPTASIEVVKSSDANSEDGWA